MLSCSLRLLRLGSTSPSAITRRSFSTIHDSLQSPSDLPLQPDHSSSNSTIEDYVAQITPSISAPVPPTPSASQPLQITKKIPPTPSWAMRPHPELYDPPRLKPTHRIHVATLIVESYNPDKHDLPVVTGFAMQAAYHLGIPVSRPAEMPIKTELHTVLRSGFVHKKSQENFWRLTHRRVIKAYDANEEVVNRWINYLRTDAAKGTNVALKAQRFLYRPMGWGHQIEELAKREAELESLERPEKHKKDENKPESSSDSVDLSTVEVSPVDAVKALAEKLIKEELEPKAEAHEAMLAATGKDGKKMTELKTTDSKPKTG